MNSTLLPMGNITIEQIDAHTWNISEGTGRGRTHCYLLEGEKQAIVIDTGFHIIALHQIVCTLTTKPITVINTHGHLDHIANNHQFSTIYMHPDDELLWNQHQQSSIRKQFMLQRFLDKGISISQELQDYMDAQAVLPMQHSYVPVQDKMRISLGNRTLRIITTPGHTLGSICILDEAFQRLFTGDTICEEGVLLHMEHAASIQTYQQSLNKLKADTASFNLLYPGHQMTPLPFVVLDHYLDCVNELLHKQKQSFCQTNQRQIAQQFTYHHASITYLANTEN